MMGSLPPGLFAGLGAISAIGLGCLGFVIHLLVAARWGRGRTNVLATAFGPVACASIGLLTFGVCEASSELQGRLDDGFFLIPVFGIVVWMFVSYSAWTYLRE